MRGKYFQTVFGLLAMTGSLATEAGSGWLVLASTAVRRIVASMRDPAYCGERESVARDEVSHEGGGG